MNAFTIKILGGIVFTIALGLGFELMKNSYIEQGRNEVRREYMESERVAILKRYADYEQILIDNAAKNLATVTDYENKLKDQANIYDKRIADIKHDGGLRIPHNSYCGTTTAPSPASPVTDNEPSDDRLPERIEEGLFAIARQADEVVTQLVACQSWIRDNGLYK